MTDENTRQLQFFGFRDSNYQRPNDMWVCGRLAAGKPCRHGPDPSGSCGVRASCLPTQEGDLWVCTRPKGDGGGCQQGPTSKGHCSIPPQKCVPKKSLANLRGVATKWLAAVTLGFIALLISASYGSDWLSPGPLSGQHAGIGDCVTCHQDQEKSMSHWIGQITAPSNAEQGSTGCQNCHKMGAEPLLAHNLTPKNLAATIMNEAETTASPTGLTLARAVFPGPTAPGEKIACATCHQEHQGATSNISEMSSDQCQSCHKENFERFDEGHPPFGAYPYFNRTAILFDHQSHISRHFPESKNNQKPTDCQDCHEAGPQGRVMTVKPFDQTCASCHLDEITGRTGSGPRNMIFLSLPGFDLETLQDQNIAIGYWPEFSENPITPFMKLLLATDMGLKADLQMLEGQDLLDLGEASPESLVAVENVAWGVKKLLFGLLVDGPTMLVEKITMDSSLSQSLTADMMASLPYDVVRRTLDSWLPNLAQEMIELKAGKILPTRLSLLDAVTKKPTPIADGQIKDGQINDPQINKDAGKNGDILGDDILADEKSDDDILAQQKDGEKDADDILSDGEDILSDGEDILSDGEDILSDGEDILSDGEDILSDGEDILSDEADADDEILADNSDDEEILDGESKDQGPAPSPAGIVEAALLPAPDMKTWMYFGGWRGEDFGLVYRAKEHSDPFFFSWISVGSRASAGTLKDLAEPVFDRLVDPGAPGKCGKCHSVDVDKQGVAKINWQARYPVKQVKLATLFSHEKHAAVLREDGCQNCHVVDPEAKYQASYKDRNPKTHSANFKPMDKATCLQCHNSETEVQECTDCHNYHFGKVTLSDMIAPLSKPGL